MNVMNDGILLEDTVMKQMRQMNNLTCVYEIVVMVCNHINLWCLPNSKAIGNENVQAQYQGFSFVLKTFKGTFYSS